MKAWIDDSGAKGQSGYLTLAGLIGKAEDWALFSDRWAAELKRHQRINYLSTSEAANLGGEFHRWPNWQRDAKVRRLATITNDFRFTAISVSVELSVFDSLKERYVESGPAPPAKSPIPKRRRTFIEEPYFFLFHLMCSAVCLEMVRQGVREEIDLFFDEQDIMKPRIEEWYPMYRSGLQDHERAIMPSGPIFRDDKKFMPLQMADFVAWVERADLSGVVHPFQPVRRGLRVKRSQYWAAWNSEQFERVFLYQQRHSLTQAEAEYGAKLREYLGHADD